MKVNPVLHRILILPDALEEKTQSGIIIKHDERKEAAVETGTVLSIGTTAYCEFGTTAQEQGIVVGAKVSFAKYAGKTIKDGDKKLLMLNDEDIVGVITE